MLFGLTSVARGTTSSSSAAMSESLASGSPRPEASTGSTTSGTRGRSATIAATARAFAAEPSTPTLNAAISLSARRRSA